MRRVKNKKISVIIPVYNGEKTIKRCIESLLKQSYNNFEIIVINDGSTDKTNLILQNFNKNPKVNILEQSNSGVSNARNVGIKNSTGEYISFVDADDYVEKDFLQDLINGMKDDIDLSVVGLRHLYPNNPQKKRIENYYDGEFSSSEVLNFLFFKHGPQGYLPNKLWKKYIILNNNIYLDPTLNVLEDAVFTVDYLLNSKNVYINNNKDYNYVHEGKTLSSGMSKDDSNYIETYHTMIRSAKQIINLVSKNGSYENKETSWVFLGMIYKDYLRRLLVDGKAENRREYKKIKKKLFKLREVISKNKYLDKKSYIIFLCTLYTPFVIRIMDEARKK